MFGEQDNRAREAHERRDAELALFKRALASRRSLETLDNRTLDEARIAPSSTGPLAKRAAAVQDDEAAERSDEGRVERTYYADGTLKWVRQGGLEKTYYPNGTIKRIRLLADSELAGSR